MTNPLPCPFCGNETIIYLEGSTFRWAVMECGNCGAQSREVRKQINRDGTTAQWEEEATELAIQEWNKRVAPYAQELACLQDKLKAAEARAAMLTEVATKAVQWLEVNDVLCKCGEADCATVQMKDSLNSQPSDWLTKHDEDVRNQALEDAVTVVDRIQDRYYEKESLKYPELKTDAATGIGDCLVAIRAIKGTGE